VTCGLAWISSRARRRVQRLWTAQITFSSLFLIGFTVTSSGEPPGSLGGKRLIPSFENYNRNGTGRTNLRLSRCSVARRRRRVFVEGYRDDSMFGSKSSLELVVVIAIPQYVRTGVRSGNIGGCTMVTCEIRIHLNR
jgi:hypothetical protein